MKIRLIATLIVLLFVLINTKSQVSLQWDAVYDGPANSNDIPKDIAVDSYGNIYTSGHSNDINTGIFDIATIKYNSAGIQLWVTRYNGPENGTDMPNKIALDQNNNVYIAGVSQPNPVLIKYNNNGNLLFINRIPGNGALQDIKLDNAGNVFICGYNNDSVIVIKYNPIGQLMWIVHYRYPGSTMCSSVSLDFDSNGNIFVCGRVIGISQEGDCLLIKFNNNGIVQWSLAYNSPFNQFDEFTYLAVLNDGSVSVIGSLADSNSFAHGILNKYSSQGVLQWNTMNQNARLNKVKTDWLNNIYVGGRFKNGSGLYGPGIIKYNRYGVMQWQNNHQNSAYSEIFWDFEIQNCMNIYMTYSGTYPGLVSYAGTSRYNSNGVLKWNVISSGVVFDASLGTGWSSMTLDNSQNVFLATTKGFNNPNLNDYHTMKYSQTFYTVSGQVTFKDNNQPVPGGIVKALYYDESSAGIITVDSTIIQPGGYYTLAKIPRDTIDIMFYQNDDLLQFVPTYYISTLDWREATKIYATQNLNNINGQVYRIFNQDNPYNINGTCIQNINQNLTEGLNDAIIYAKSGSEFKNFGISLTNGNFTVSKLAAGTYTLTAHRMGFSPVTQNITITNGNLNGVNLSFGNPIGIEPKPGKIPENYNLSQNFPNPFNPLTHINFDIPKENFVKLAVYNILGKEVEALVNEKLNAGSYSVEWNASKYSSGIYFYRIESGNFIKTMKMILIK